MEPIVTEGRAPISSGRARKIWESVGIAVDALRAHKLRSFLTLLGIIISVMTLIAVVSVIEGMNRYIADRIANIGSNVFLITRFPILTSAEDFVKAEKRNRFITMEDFEYIREHLTLAQDVGVEVHERRDVRYVGQKVEDISIRGVTANIIQIDIEQVESGRYVSDADNEHRSQTAFIGRDLADTLFPGLEPIGKYITVDGRPFEVVGVAKRIGTTFGQSQDNFAYVPVNTLMKIFGSNRSVTINVKCTGPDRMQETQDQARMLMRARRHLSYHEPDNFGIIASESINDLWKNLTGSIAATTIAITSIFLVVGGIVIMNIMLATVTERTREIGIRKSLGATRRDILLQFLVESSVLATCGGVIGVVSAFLLTTMVSALTPIPSSLPISAVVLAVIMSTVVGLFFGIYPANKAAKLDPVEALRAEG